MIRRLIAFGCMALASCAPTPACHCNPAESVDAECERILKRLEAPLVMTDSERSTLVHDHVAKGKRFFCELEYEKARDEFTRACDLDPEDAEARKWRDETRKALEKSVPGFDRAVMERLASSCMSPTPVTDEVARLLVAGETLFVAGELDQARDEFAAALDLVRWFPSNERLDALEALAVLGLQRIRARTGAR